MNRLLVGLFLILSLVLAHHAFSASAAPATPINTLCPIKGDAVDPDTETVTYQGHTIGFCCGGCDTKWAKWTDEQKTAFVNKSLAAAPVTAPTADARQELTGTLVDLAAFMNTAATTNATPAHHGPAALLVTADPRSAGQDQLYILIASSPEHLSHITSMLASKSVEPTTLRGTLVNKAGLKALMLDTPAPAQPDAPAPKDAPHGHH